MGLLLALASAFSATAKDIVSKSFASRVHPDLSTLASFIFALPFYLILIIGAKLFGLEPFNFSGNFILLVVLRSITDVFAEGFKMKAFAAGDISLVTSFLSLSPLILALLSPFVTGDTVTKTDLIALLFIVLGSLLLVRRDKVSGKLFQRKALVYAVLASVAFALNSCFDRLAVTKSGPILSGFAMTALAGALCLPIALRHTGATADLMRYRRGFLTRGALETLFMVSKLFALSMLEAHVVMGVTRVSLILSVLAGRIWFGERDTSRRVVAALFMYLGLIILFWSRG